MCSQWGFGGIQKAEAWKVYTSQVMQGLVCHAEEFGFYFEDSGELLRHYEQGSDVIRFLND